MKNQIIWESAETMGMNPASVEMDTGRIILNRDVFPQYSEFTQKFILEHERGHYLLPTDSEEEADAYALTKLYKSTNQSLKKTMKAITDFIPVHDPRVENLYRKALLIDSEYNNNQKAKEELKNITEKSMRGKLASSQSPFIRFNAIGNYYKRADGEETDGSGETDGGGSVAPPETNNHRRNRIKKQSYDVFGIQMTVMEILFAIFIVVYFVKHK
jgi:hypothetical protein